MYLSAARSLEKVKDAGIYLYLLKVWTDWVPVEYPLNVIQWGSLENEGNISLQIVTF